MENAQQSVQASVQIGKRDMSVSETHWQALDESYSLIGKKHILYFPGGGVASSRQSNGDVKRIIKTLDKAGILDATILSVYYDQVPSVVDHRICQLKEIHELKDSLDSWKESGQRHKPYYLPFFEAYFAPLVTGLDGRRLSVSSAKENMRNLIIIGHCYGSTMAFEMELLLQKRMADLGYTADERAEIQRQLVILTYASRIPVGVSKSTLFHITSLSDPQKGQNWKAENLQEFLNPKTRNTQKTAFIAWNNHEVMLAADKLLVCSVDEHDVIACFESLEEGMDKTVIGTHVARTVRSFLAQMYLGQERCDLKEMIFNLPKVSFLETTEKTGKVLMQEYRGYLKRCQAGRKKVFELIEKKDSARLEKLAKEFNIPFSLRNEQGDFPVHAALKTGDEKVIETVVTHAPGWFQSLNFQEQAPLLIALSTGKIKAATLLWEKMKKVVLPVFENYHSLRHVQKQTLLWTAQQMSEQTEFTPFFDFIANDNFILSSQEILSLVDSRQSIAEKPYLKNHTATLKSLDKFLIGYIKNMQERDLFRPIGEQNKTTGLIDILALRLQEPHFHDLIVKRREIFAMNHKMASWGRQRGA